MHGARATGGVVQAAGVVRSVKDINGNFTYSPCQMIFIGEGNDIETVVASYQNQTSDKSSDYFLDQPVRGNA